MGIRIRIRTRTKKTRTFFFLCFAWVHAGKVWDPMLKDPLLTFSSQCRPWVPMSQCPSLSQSILSYPILSTDIGTLKDRKSQRKIEALVHGDQDQDQD